MNKLDRPQTPLSSDLKKVFGNVNPRTLKAFEQLFEAVPSDLNSISDELDELDMNVSIADAKARVALSLVEIAMNLSEIAAIAPAGENAGESDLHSPSVPESTDEYDDASPVREFFEIHDFDVSPPHVPIDGASGTFTTVDSKTVTVENGIITEIA